MVQSLDSGAAIPAGPAAASGYSGVFRYTYNLTRREVDAAHAAGLWVAPIAEYDTVNPPTHPVSQYPERGLGHGQNERVRLAALGAPAGCVDFATGDTWIPQSAYGNVARYLDGFRQGLGAYRPGIYGGARLVRWCLDNGHADVGWVAGAASWDDGVNPKDARAVAHQLPAQKVVGGVNCDLNDMYDVGAWGQWYVDGLRPDPPAPPTPYPPVEDDVNRTVIMADGGQYMWNGGPAIWEPPAPPDVGADPVKRITDYVGIPLTLDPKPLNAGDTEYFLSMWVDPFYPPVDEGDGKGPQTASQRFHDWRTAHPEVP